MQVTKKICFINHLSKKLLVVSWMYLECMSYIHLYICISWVQFLSCVWLFATPWTAACRLPCPSPTPGTCSNLCSSSRSCHPTISSVGPFSSHLQSFPAKGSFQMSQFFASGSQSIGVSASASVLPMNIHGWFPLGWTSWISLQSKRLSRAFSNTTV